MPKSRIFNVANMSFHTLRENKILTKFPNLQYLDYDIPMCFKATLCSSHIAII